MKIRNTMKIRTDQSTRFVKRTSRSDSRQGITLLFVVSMIVLFLLMGTAFVIVSNDFFRASRPRLRAEVYTVDRTALVHKTFYNIVRGPDLADMFSPFRGNDLLSDQYGYGFKAYVNETVDDMNVDSSPIEVAGTSGQFIQIALAAGTAGSANDVDNAIWQLHDPGATTPTMLSTVATGLGDTDDLFSGQVITFTSE